MRTPFHGLMFGWILFAFLVSALGDVTLGLAAPTRDEDLTKMSLEELMEIEVTSVAKRAQKLSETAAAIYVITGEELRRSGATTIMDALRVVPGIQVAQIDANKWAITSRGFNGRFANKLLVLVDGRSVYTPFFSGVFWDSQNMMLEDIERIEVIRGPGASVWGANAVNGIINIITKGAKETQGGLVESGGGTHERAFGNARYGGKIGKDAYYRVFGDGFDRTAWKEESGRDGNDDYHGGRAGFRLDWDISQANALSIDGQIYDSRVGQRYLVPTLTFPFQQTEDDDADISGGHLLGRWIHQISQTSEISFQTYYARSRRGDIAGKVNEDTLDLDFQHDFSIGRRQHFTWGIGYRYTRTGSDEGITASFDPESRNDNLFSAFLQDEIALIEDRLSLTLGTKIEHNDYTGSEIQPSGRIRWTLNDRNVIWGSVSRAVRTPSRAEADTRTSAAVLPPSFPSQPIPVFVTFKGNEDFDSEELWAYEAGYRMRPSEWLSFDLAVFYNRYQDLRTMEPAATSLTFDPRLHVAVLTSPENKMKGKTYGLELASDLIPVKWWRVRLAYTYLEMSLKTDSDSVDTESENNEDESPAHQLSIFSMMDLPWNLQLDTRVRYVDNLRAQDVPSYVTMDVRVGWRPKKALDFSLVGQNLLEKRHKEFSAELFQTPSTEVERSVYGKVTWRF